MATTCEAVTDGAGARNVTLVTPIKKGQNVTNVTPLKKGWRQPPAATFRGRDAAENARAREATLCAVSKVEENREAEAVTDGAARSLK